MSDQRGEMSEDQRRHMAFSRTLEDYLCRDNPAATYLINYLHREVSLEEGRAAAEEAIGLTEKDVGEQVAAWEFTDHCLHNLICVDLEGINKSIEIPYGLVPLEELNFQGISKFLESCTRIALYDLKDEPITPRSSLRAQDLLSQWWRGENSSCGACIQRIRWEGIAVDVDPRMGTSLLVEYKLLLGEDTTRDLIKMVIRWVPR